MTLTQTSRFFLAAIFISYATFRLSRALKAVNCPKKFSLFKKIQDNPSVDDGGKIRVNPDYDCSDEELAKKVLPAYGGNMTTWDLFKSVVKRFPKRDFHGTLDASKKWKWESYESVYEDVLNIAKGMEVLKLISEAKGDSSMRVFALFGPNCSEWVRCEYAAVSRGATTVTLYNTLTKEGISHVLNLTGTEVVLCPTTECALRCLDAKSITPNLKGIVVLTKTPELTAEAEKLKVTLHLLDDIRAAGKRVPSMMDAEPTPSTIFSFCFTSGSTGLPKGALISHHAMVLNVASMTANIQVINTLNFEQGEVYLSYLPVAHQMERAVQLMMVAFGSSIGFSRGDPTLISKKITRICLFEKYETNIKKNKVEDVALLRPTIFCTVPRLLNRLQNGIQTKVDAAGGIKKKLFNYAMKSKLDDLTNYHHFTHPIWDRLVFNKIRKQLGFDRCKQFFTGSAPVAPRILDYLRVVFSLPITEGYGQTEATCAATISHPLHAGGPEERPSHVGGPVPNVDVRLESIPEMQYLTTDREHDGKPVIGRGHVLIRAGSVMNGYFQLKEKTAETIVNGWLRTGDVGAWLPDGTLTIIDRANNIFKTAFGEYIQPDKVERAVCRCPVVASAFVFGTTLNTKLVAIIVINPEALPVFCQENGVDATDETKLRAAITSGITRCCKGAGLYGYEIPAAISIQRQPFSIESGVLTATSKLVRGVAKEFFKTEIQSLYKEIGEEVKI